MEWSSYLDAGFARTVDETERWISILPVLWLSGKLCVSFLVTPHPHWTWSIKKWWLRTYVFCTFWKTPVCGTNLFSCSSDCLYMHMMFVSVRNSGSPPIQLPWNKRRRPLDVASARGTYANLFNICKLHFAYCSCTWACSQSSEFDIILFYFHKWLSFSVICNGAFWRGSSQKGKAPNHSNLLFRCCWEWDLWSSISTILHRLDHYLLIYARSWSVCACKRILNTIQLIGYACLRIRQFGANFQLNQDTPVQDRNHKY